MNLYVTSRITNPLVLLSCLMTTLLFNQNAVAVDETIPHPIIERGTLSQVAIKAMEVFRDVEVVIIKNSAVQAHNIKIEPRTVIVIENQDQTNHRLTFLPADSNELMYAVNSPVISPGERWGAEFLDAGIYPFHCTLHPEHVHGEIVVSTGD